MTFLRNSEKCWQHILAASFLPHYLRRTSFAYDATFGTKQKNTMNIDQYANVGCWLGPIIFKSETNKVSWALGPHNER